jgi:anaerobic magnesium-protoporphyrin IX monomethyl ester cyclase
MLALYNPRSNAQRKPILPMALLALGAVLEGDHDYTIVDGNLDDDPVSTIDRLVRDCGADALAVTVMPGPQLHDAVPVCRELKARHPDLMVVWGGYFPTQHPEVCLQAPFVDHVVRGHGELSFAALVDRFSKGEKPQELPGLARLDVTGGAHISAPAPVPDPNDLPDFPYHRIDVEKYVRPTFMGQRTLAHHSSYGCPFRCNFCAVVNMVDGSWKAQSAERTAAVVRRLVTQHGADAIEFYDNNFFTSEARVAEFADRVADLDLGWWGESRIDTMLGFSDSTWRALARSGLRMVFLGAESGSDETLARMNKGGTASVAKTLEIVDLLRRHRIVPELSFVIGNPPDAEADTRHTLAFIREVKRVNPATEIIMYAYTPVPLSGELYEQAQAAGFAFPDTLEGWISPQWQELIQRRADHLPWIDDPLRRQLQDFEYVLNARYPTVTDARLGPTWRAVLRAAASWRYRYERYGHPVELRALQRLLRYRRPETAGF